jgi:hypothetical protein
MRIKNSTRTSEERDPLGLEDLAKLFGSEEYRDQTHRRPYMFWTPLLALYTRVKQTEIAQLHLADFQAIDGVSVISINDTGYGKRIKTKASRRGIPAHAELIRLGMLGWRRGRHVLS